VRRYAKILWIGLLIVALQVGSISALLVTYAAPAGTDLTEDIASSFLTGVDIKEIDGTNPGASLVGQANIEKDTDFFLMFNFLVDNLTNISAGDFIKIPLPKEINVGAILEANPLKLIAEDEDGDPIHIANAYTDGNSIYIEFVSFDPSLSNVGGAFFIAGGFDENEIVADGNDTDIEFDFPKSSIAISFKPDPQPELQKVKVQKAGQRATGTDIAWTVTLDNQAVDTKTHFTADLENAFLVDSLPSSQVLDTTTVQVNGVAIDPAKVSVDANNKLKVDLGTIASESNTVITFVTKLKDQTLQDTLSAGETSIPVSNQVDLEYDPDEKITSNTPTVTIPVNILSKSGSKQETTTANNTKNIKWTVVVNEDELDFKAAAIKDTLPTGLTYIAGSATVNGASATPSVLGSVLNFALGDITGKVTITYETEIDPAVYQKNSNVNYSNSAVLTWDGLPAGAGVGKTETVGIGSNLFKKYGNGYNRANGVISWKIVVNEENIRLDAPTIIDTVPDDQEYIVGSQKVVDQNNNVITGISFGISTNINPTTTDLKWVFPTEIPMNGPMYTITFDTKPKSTQDITANKSGKFSNSANFKSGTLDITVPATQNYTSKVFEKQAAGYDMSTRTITWNLIVNENGATTASSPTNSLDPTNVEAYKAIQLDNVVIKDQIPDGLQFLKDETVVRNGTGNPVTNLVTIDDSSNPVTFTFNGNITEQYTIRIKTKVVDESKFTAIDNLNNGNFQITNEAEMTHGKTNTKPKDNAVQEVENSVVAKKAVTTSYGDEHIDWVVYINASNVDLNTLLDVEKFWFVDKLQEGLILDTTSVELYQLSSAFKVPDSIPAGGNDGKAPGTKVTLNSSQVKYDAVTREFRFNFPESAPNKTDLKTPYKLKYRTYLDDNVRPNTEFTNGIKLYGSKGGVPVSIEESYKSNDKKRVNFTLMGSMAYADMGKLVVNKVDIENENKKLNATFALYDKDGNKVQQKTTVDGKLEFTRVKIGNPFFVKEVTAPTGYLNSGAATVDSAAAAFTGSSEIIEGAVKVTIPSAATTKSVELTFKNKIIKANITFTKTNESNSPLAGAVFGIYPRGATSTTIPTVTSNASGVVEFKDVPYGLYDIREITAPTGYVTLSGVVHAVAVGDNDNGKTFTHPDVSNSLIKTNLTFKKLDDSGTGLAGAKFTLYDLQGNAVVTKTSDPNGEVTSGANGVVVFEDVLAGSYKIRESHTPSKYVDSKEYVTTLAGSDTITVTESNHGTPITLKDVTNVLIQATISFDKEDNSGKPLAGAVFGLYDVQDNEVKTATSANGTGKVSFTNVGQGVYTIKEKVTPTGYLPDTTSTTITGTVEITSADHSSVKSLAKVVNTLILANIEFQKQNEKGQPLADAEFGLYPRGAVAGSTPVATATSSATGKVLFENVKLGSYDIREIQAPFLYRTLTGVVHAVDVTAVKHNTTITLASVSNSLIQGSIKFKKLDDSGKELQGAGFTLYDLSTPAKAVATATSDENGIVEFTNVKEGKYRVLETTTPIGYVPNTDYVKTANDEEIIEVREINHAAAPIMLKDVTNVYIQASIEFDKHDGKGQSLAGAVFGLYDGQKNEVQRATSLSTGKVTFTNVSEGTYTIKEITPPTGYLLDTTSNTVTKSVVVTAANHADVIQLDTVVNELIKANIEFEKQNEKGQPLAGANFGLYSRGAAAGSNPIDTAISNASGKVRFNNVEYGAYDIREIQAPFGYLTLLNVVRQVEVSDNDNGKLLTYAAVSNALIKSSFTFTKLDDSGAGLKDAEFTLFNLKNPTVAVAVAKSDNNGLVEFNDVLAGKYKVQETKTPFGYVPNNSFVKTLSGEDEIEVLEADHGIPIILADVTNVLIQTSIEFTKNNEKNQPLPGASFGLYNAAGSLVDTKVSQANGLVEFTEVGEGNYTIKEISPPYGYLPITGVIYSQSVKYTDHNKPIKLASVANTLIEANIEFTKVSEKGKPLAGAVFELVDANDVVLQTVTSNTSGKVVFTKVLEGSYDIREKTPPTGYNPITGGYVVKGLNIHAADHYYLAGDEVKLPEVSNQIIRGDIQLTKVHENSNRGLRGAKFALYAADDTKFDYEIATAISDQNGIVLFEKVEYGDYVITEVVSPGGYYLSKDKLTVSITEEGKLYNLGNFANKPLPVNVVQGIIEIKKTNTFGDALSGAKFGLYNAAGYLLETLVSNSSGIIRFTDVDAGLYYVKEIDAPKNYVVSTQEESVTISDDKSYAQLTFINERSSDAPWPKVTVKKVDDTGAPLAGVTFALFKATDKAFANAVDSSKTNVNGVATFKDVAPGDYVVKEIVALEGYILSTVTLPIKVTDEGTFNAGTVENRLIRGDIAITKVNEENEPLQGAEFGLYDKAGKLVTRVVSNSNGLASFKDIPYGSYTLRELNAPASYVKTEDVIAIKITVDGAVQAFKIVNKKVETLPVDESGVPGSGPGSNSGSGTGSNAGSGSNGSGGSSSGGTTGTAGNPNTGNADSGTPGKNGETATGGKGNSVKDAAKSNNELPKTGDYISTMIWLFASSGLLLTAILVLNRRKAKKQ